MGNCWDFDGNQRHPPSMDAWSKIKLGLLNPTILTESGYYSIEAIHETPQVNQITEGFPAGEYLLIKNRQPEGCDKILPQSGLVIWHVDEKAPFENQEMPGQAGWPATGNTTKLRWYKRTGNISWRGEGYGDETDV